MKRFEPLEHTADVGLRIFGGTRAELLAHAAQGMFALIGQATFPDSEQRELSLQIVTPGIPTSMTSSESRRYDEDLLIAFMKRLLQEFNLHSFFPVSVHVELTSDGCTARLGGGTFDLARHAFNTEIKGVTLHGLKVVKIDSGWEAEVVFDV